MGIVGYVVTTRDDMDDWVVRHALFASQVMYGYLSLPFFLFTLPYIQVVLTHAVPTAYDREGRVQKFKKPKKSMKDDQDTPRESIVDKFMATANCGDLVEDMKIGFQTGHFQLRSDLKKGSEAIPRKMSTGSRADPAPQMVGTAA